MTSAIHSESSMGSTADTRRVGRAAGLVAGPLFLTVVALLTWAELDDMHRLGWHYTEDNKVPWPSGLALGHLGAIQVVNFAVAGLLVLVFARAFRHELTGRAGRVGGWLLTVLGAALLFSAFPTDHAAAAGASPNTWHGKVHSGAFVVVALCSLLAPIFVAVALRRRPGWRGVAAASAAVPVLLIASFVAQNQLHDIAFTAFLVVIFGWLALLATRLPA
jgi:Protein of unknown function (DUF998)